MTNRRILHCVLLLCVLVMAGSDNGSTNAGQPKKENRSRTTNANINPSASQSNQRQRRDQSSNSNNEAAQDTNSNASANSNTSGQPTNGSQKAADQTKGTDQGQKELNQGTGQTWLAMVMDWIIPALVIAAGLLILALIATGVLHLRNQSRQHLEHRLGKVAAANAAATREAQKEILDKLSSLSSAQNDTSTRLHDVHTEIRTLARLVRETSPSRGDGRSYSALASSYAQNEPSPPKEEPEFPVFAGDYLGKMTRFANSVKPDFQNGILISDPDGTGELMLIRDSRYPDETQPLFVVPRYAQFQTPQDFYTYYEKYYDCMKPGAGEVWIIDPAVVEKVSGGWLLREKGVLEIR
jgi:hypothetical protein